MSREEFVGLPDPDDEKIAMVGPGIPLLCKPCREERHDACLESPRVECHCPCTREAEGAD